MADKSFGVKELNLLNASGTPTVTSPNNLNLNANTVAISTSCTIGNNLTVTSTTTSANVNVTGIATVVNFNATGISTIVQPADSNPMVNWTITNNSASAYRFTGPGQSGTEDNPNIYLVRGHRYIFKHNATSSHPIQIRFANGGSAYTDGVTYSDTGNNRTTDGNNLIFNVQHDAPAQLFYQCTSHGSMVGNIYIVGGPQVISGVVTATTFVGNLTGNPTGSGANLTNLPAANLTGTLPAISGANLTGISAAVTSDAQGNTVGGTNSGDSFSGTSAINNTLFGYNSGTAITSGDKNTSIGYDALKTMTTTERNTAVGFEALKVATGDLSCAFGSQALRADNGNGYNCAFGASSGYSVTSGSDNSFLGYTAGNNLETGNYNIVLGAWSRTSSTSVSRECTIGGNQASRTIQSFRIPGIGLTISSSSNTPFPTSGSQLYLPGNAEFVGVGTFSGSVTVGYDTTYSPIQQAANTWFYTRADQATSVSGSNIANLATGSIKISETIPISNMTRQSDAGAHSFYNSSSTSGSVTRDMTAGNPFAPKSYGLTMGTMFYAHTSGNNGSGVIHYGWTPTSHHFFVRYKYSSVGLRIGADTDGSDTWTTAYQDDLLSDSNWYFFVIAVERNGTLLTSLNGAPLTPIRMLGTAPAPTDARFGLAGDGYADNDSRHRYATAFWYRGVMSNELIAQEYAWLKTIWTGASLP